MFALLAICLSALCLFLFIRHLRQRDTPTLGDLQPENPTAHSNTIDHTPVSEGDSADALSSANPPQPLPATSGKLLHPESIDPRSFLPDQFVIFDLETTGLSPHSHEIIEFGAIRFTFGQSEHETFQMLSNPRRKLSRKIAELTGITQEEIDRDGKDPEMAFRAFLEFIGDLPLVAFNAEFDIGFLNAAAQRYGIPFCNQYTCALKRSRRAWPQLESHRLAFIAEVFGFPCHNHHRAVADCERTLYAFWYATIEVGTKVRWLKPKPFQPLPSAIDANPASLQAS